jgi:hypothetical protein
MPLPEKDAARPVPLTKPVPLTAMFWLLAP